MHPLCVEQKVCTTMKEPGSGTGYVTWLSVLAQLHKLHLLPGHVTGESHKVQIGGHKDASLLHQVSHVIWQNLQAWK